MTILMFRQIELIALFVVVHIVRLVVKEFAFFIHIIERQVNVLGIGGKDICQVVVQGICHLLFRLRRSQLRPQLHSDVRHQPQLIDHFVVVTFGRAVGEVIVNGAAAHLCHHDQQASQPNHPISHKTFHHVFSTMFFLYL